MGPPKTTTNLFFLFFAPYFDSRNDATASSPIVNVLHSLSPDYIPLIGPTLDWLLCLPIYSKQSKVKAPTLSLFLFFRRSIRPPQMAGKRPPPHVPPGCIASPTSHPPPTSSFGWLLHSFIKWQPPKTVAPPISQFFYGCHWGAPIKLLHSSEPKPGHSVPE